MTNRPPNEFELRNPAANLDYCRSCGASSAEDAIACLAPLIKTDFAGVLRSAATATECLPAAIEGMSNLSHAGLVAWSRGWAETMGKYLRTRAQGVS